MHSKIFLAASIALLISLVANAQTARQPFDDIGKEVKVLSLTNGKYEEFFDDDSLQRIGTALININTMKVVKLQLTDEEQRIMDNSANSRFLTVDPLSRSYSELTPYQFASNRPIDGNDLDGREWSVKTFSQPAFWGLTKKNITEFTVKLKVVIDPNDKDAQAKREEILKAQEYFSNTFARNGTFVKEEVRSKLVVQFVSSETGLDPLKDFYLIFGPVEGGQGTVEFPFGIGSTQTNKITIDWADYKSGRVPGGSWESKGIGSWTTYSWYSYIGESIVHELGHTAGLMHFDDPDNPTQNEQIHDKQNLMNWRDRGKWDGLPGASLEYKRNHVTNNQLGIVYSRVKLQNDHANCASCTKSKAH